MRLSKRQARILIEIAVDIGYMPPGIMAWLLEHFGAGEPEMTGEMSEERCCKKPDDCIWGGAGPCDPRAYEWAREKEARLLKEQLSAADESWARLTNENATLRAHVAALEHRTKERCALYLDMLARHHPHLAEAYRHAATNLRAQTTETLAMMDALPLPSVSTDLDATR